MFKLKHVGVAAVLVLVAAGAMASNFRAADQVYVPAAGHLAITSATFISDVWISNVSTTDTVSVSVIYTPTGTNVSPQYFDRMSSICFRASEKSTPTFSCRPSARTRHSARSSSMAASRELTASAQPDDRGVQP